MRTIHSAVRTVGICLLSLVLLACGTTDGSLREQGRSESYITGFHDGRHSGMKEAGNYLEHIVKDTQRFKEDADYQSGWLAGEAEGKRIQEQSDAAVNSYNAQKIADQAAPNPEDAAKEAMKGVDTDALKALEK